MNFKERLEQINETLKKTEALFQQLVGQKILLEELLKEGNEKTI